MAKSKRNILVRQAKAATILRKREARNDFWAYCLYHDPKFFAKRLFLKKVADAFTRIYEAYIGGVIRRLAVSMPLRAGKSYISSLFISWMLGHFPEESVMRNCCSDTLYNKLSMIRVILFVPSDLKRYFRMCPYGLTSRMYMDGALRQPGRSVISGRVLVVR